MNKPAFVHGEAFCLMTYEADDGSEREIVWNSRDGVTPFVISLRSGKPARHVDWHLDQQVPDHRPALGSRMFVDLTRERAEAAARRNAERWWDDPQYPASAAYGDVEDLVRALTEHYYGDGHQPDLIEVVG